MDTNESIPSGSRVESIDMLRGLVIVLMALDHTRLAFGHTQFSPTDLTLSTAGFFFTRWVTHFCAPVFVLLAGTGTRLYGERIKSPSRLSRFLLKRGLWLIILEVLWVNTSFNASLPWVSGGVFIQVLWALGASMIVMAALIHLPMKWIVIISITMILGHNAFDGISTFEAGKYGDLWAILHVRTLINFTEPFSWRLFVSYPLIPWIGVMGLGYALGSWMEMEDSERQKRLVQAGSGLIAAFIVVRGINLYGDPSAWMVRREGVFYTIMSFINTTKYPPSLDFLLMTLGPSLLLLAWFDTVEGVVRRVLTVFGRVPLFFYLLHLPLIVGTSVAFWYLRFDRVIFFMSSWGRVPNEYEPSLTLVYVAWFFISLALYPVCLYYGKVKFSEAGRARRWLKYL